MMMNESLIALATFDLIPTELVDKELFYFPEEDPFSLAFAQCGYESNLFLNNAGFLKYFIMAHLFLAVIYLVLYKVKPVQRRMASYLQYNGLIRLLMEAYQDVILFSVLDVYYLNQKESRVGDSPFESVN